MPSVDELHLCLGRLRGISGVARTRTTVVLATRFEMRPHLLEPGTVTGLAAEHPVEVADAPGAAK